MILRCSVIRSPFSAQSASISILRAMPAQALDKSPGASRLPGPPPREERSLLPGAGAAALGAEADLLGQRAALLGIVRSDHRIVGIEAPLLPIFVRGHLVMRHQVPLQHLQLLAVFQADDVVRLDGGADGDS